MEGDPRFDASQRIPYMPFHEYARLIGLGSVKVDRASQIEDAMTQAFAADRPFVIDAMTDPEEPPLPPHITFKQAEDFTKSFLADPSGGLVGVVNAMREKVDEFVPGR
jgi:pyruvate dehydrogenase (quinone)